MILDALIGSLIGSFFAIIAIFMYTSWRADRVHEELLKRRKEQFIEVEKRIARYTEAMKDRGQENNNDHITGGAWSQWSSFIDTLEGDAPVENNKAQDNNIVKFPNKQKKDKD